MKPSSIRKKAILMNGVLFLFLIVCIVLISYRIILRGFTSLENEYMVVNTKRVINSFSDTLVNLESTATDWASWDDTYQFIEGQNELYRQINLTDQTFINLRLNLMLLVDSSQQIIFMKGYDFLENKEISLNSNDIKQLISKNIKRVHSNIKGFVFINSTPVFVVINPILKSDNSGPSNGILILGRFLDKREIQRIEKATQLSITISPIDNNLDSQKNSLKESDIIVRFISDEKISGFTIQKDIYGHPAFYVTVEMDRQIYQHGLKTIQYYILFLIGIGMCFIVAMLLIMERAIFTPLNNLTKIVGNISQHRDFSKKIAITRKDELGNLAESINILLESIQEMMRSIQESEDQVKKILNTVLAGIIIIDPDTRIIVEANAAAAHMIGEKRENIIGKQCHHFICKPEENDCPVLRLNKRIDTAEKVLITARGEKIPVLKTIATVVLNHKVHLLESFMDISEWLLAEEERLKNEKLKTALEITGAVCHELNQPLAAIYGFIDITKMKLHQNHPMWDTIEKIQENAERIKSITHKLLGITRYETTNYTEGIKIMDIDKSSQRR